MKHRTRVNKIRASKKASKKQTKKQTKKPREKQEIKHPENNPIEIRLDFKSLVQTFIGCNSPMNQLGSRGETIISMKYGLREKQ